MTVPVLLFVYDRPEHTRKTVEALQQNILKKNTDLIIYSDAARTQDNKDSVLAVRMYVAGIKGFRSVSVHYRPYNFGLAKSIIEGVSEVLVSHEAVIVLEDDMVTSKYFLTYMNDALERYAEDERVVSIHGYVYPVAQTLPEAFFIPGADCWGWATWKRGWKCFNPDGQYLLDELKRRNMVHAFDLNGAYSYSKMLEGQIKGKNDSWAIRWYASAFLAGKLTLYPGRSLVYNIGNDNSGRHCGESDQFDIVLSKTPINIDQIKVESSQEALQAFEVFLKKSTKSVLKRVIFRLHNLLSLLLK